MVDSGFWNRAEVEYTFLIERYPTSDEAMAAYLHVADYHRDNNHPALAEKWLEDAEQHFDRMIVRGTGSTLEAKALIFKADLYERKGQPEKSAAVLIELFEKYPRSESGRRAMLGAVRIHRDRLDDRVKADSLIQVLRTSLSELATEFEI